MTISDRKSLEAIKINCPTDGDNVLRYICKQHEPVFNGFRREAEDLHDQAISKIDTIKILLPEYNLSSRERRFAPLILGSVTAIASATNSYFQLCREANIKHTINILERGQYNLEDKYIDLREDFSTMTRITGTSLQNVTTSVTHVNHQQ